MEGALPVAVGLVLAGIGLAISLFLGMIQMSPKPGWSAAFAVIVWILAGQWISFTSFRKGVALRVCLGVVLALAVAAGFVFWWGSLPWEPQYPDGSQPITWRSEAVFVALVAVSELCALFFFRKRNAQLTSAG
jgi:hypothetical protein